VPLLAKEDNITLNTRFKAPPVLVVFCAGNYFSCFLGQFSATFYCNI
jgi:hypothetical protein